MFAKKIKVKIRSVRRKRRKQSLLFFKKEEDLKIKQKSLSELVEIGSIEELLPFLNSRARRTCKRGFVGARKEFFEELNLVKYSYELKQKTSLKTHFRDVPILPRAVGKKVEVHTGKKFFKFEILKEMIGHYLGEFALTRKIPKHDSPGVGATKSSKAKASAKK